ncbi:MULTISPECIES: phosphoenolpyruvate--protein phosphotransferase [unclassified Beijerinckia]|uniref:phosphoenolpyruvate--protein phosphotransferase n=1 Tax=unclassified Beijerinckia TaxID=2638183 RepID=UPI000897E78C|nr:MULTISPECIES: phosphoenolpyruvate--protein phosphotransferase [unclassified Beijerinckia]MDH7799477.1 phosphotransferase system enzyme I (PtsP) [Beijerinckia sp. GAS462]SED51825.1 phosphotransferase system, enzyme I, PtsP [Beijerinckia sp. 28-YEA-48]
MTTRGAIGGPRLLLRRLREVMAEPVTAQARLDKIVVQIASNMVAEVCSVYVLRDDGRLELFATEGLNREAVHLTTLRIGEGLVGLIAQRAEPLSLTDAQAHPAFSYKPETGEEIYQSFVGVPILRGGNTLGVLVVQNRARRTYSEEEIEVLETISMLLAEMIASGELQSIVRPGIDIGNRRPMALRGTAISEGVGLGHVVLHEPRVIVTQIIAEDTQREEERLNTAIEAMRANLDELLENDGMGGGEHREVLETFRMVANDRGWLRRLREAVRGGITAEAAVERVQNEARARLQRQADPYLRERLHDLDELANRLLHQLTGQELVTAPENLPDNAILVARSMGPAALLDYDRKRLRGLVLEDAGSSSHVAIVARALGIPTIGDVANITSLVEQGDAIIVDGSVGEVQLRPQHDVELAYSEKARLRARRQEQYRALRDTPSKTQDGVDIGLHMNAGLLVDLPLMAEAGVASIGLFRTELQFMLAPQFPRQEKQYALYNAVMQQVQDGFVTFRTLDIGGDKILPYMKTFEEENPALGWRAIRIGLDRPGLLRLQLRALLRAGAGRQLRIMFPMVASVEEFDAARACVYREIDHLRRHGHIMPSDLKLGVMIEVPSLLWQLDELLQRADFLSVGSNDLMQYLYAADRDNKRVSSRYDPMSPPALRALKRIADRANLAGKSLTLCGEIGGKPLEAMALIGIGYRSLSMSPASIGPVKAMLLGLNAGEITEFIGDLLDRRTGQTSLRPDLIAFAEAKGVPL